MKFALFCLTLSAFAATAAAAPAPTNVVLFLADDMGWMDSSVYGSSFYETPNLDRFAKRATRFTQAYASPLCSPTRASILTGKYSPRHGILSATGHQPPQQAGFRFMPESGPANRPMISPISKNYLDLAEHTLAEALREAGYATAHIGKWHLGLTAEHRPEKQGFDVAWHCAPDPGPPGEYFSPYGVLPEGMPNGRNKVGTITDGPPGEYIVDRQAAEAVNFIRANQKHPFFLNLWCYGVHGPWGHKPEYTAEFAKKANPSSPQRNPIMASMIRSVDECFGRILDELEALGLTENTLVIFYSDNGGNTHSNIPGTSKTAAAEKNKNTFLTDWRKWAGDQPPTNNHPLRDGKGSLYEGGTRVPMLWALPGRIREGKVTNALAGHIDVYPTILDLLNLAKKPGQTMDGISLSPALTGASETGRETFFNFFPFQQNGGGVTVVQGHHKLIRWFSPDTPRELYDLNTDLSETQNLASSLPDKVAELEALTDAFLEETGALVPRANPAYQPRPSTATKPTRPLGGWVPKGCSVEQNGETLIITGETRQPFLGKSGLKLKGPVSVKLHTRSSGGQGKIQWRTLSQESFPAEGQIVEFSLPAATDQPVETLVVLPAESLQHLRLYLPAHNSPLVLEKVELLGAP